MSPISSSGRGAIQIQGPPAISAPARSVCRIIEGTRGVKFEFSEGHVTGESTNLIEFLSTLSHDLSTHSYPREAATLTELLQVCTAEGDFGGYSLSPARPLDSEGEKNVLFLCTAWFEALNSADRANAPSPPLMFRPPRRRGMTMTEKIFAQHDIQRRGYVKPGDIVQVDVDWCLASELSWRGMERIYDAIGKPGIYRNDRFWLAGDHRVEPSLYHHPKVKGLMDASTRAKYKFKMNDFQGFNYTIMHTEFVRERAQPEMLIIGADSHSCSAGAVSCLSIGMGSTDVAMPLVTGQTWFRIPETVQIHLVNGRPPGWEEKTQFSSS